MLIKLDQDEWVNFDHICSISFSVNESRNEGKYYLCASVRYLNGTKQNYCLSRNYEMFEGLQMLKTIICGALDSAIDSELGICDLWLLSQHSDIKRLQKKWEIEVEQQIK